MKRGTYGFDVTNDGDLINSAGNVELLRKMWMGREIVEGYYLGPGNPGDFNYGAWHSSCHLAGAGGVYKTKKGKFLFLEISFDSVRMDYYASLTVKENNNTSTYRIDSTEGRSLIDDAILVGFIEGNSQGRISARFINDPPNLFNSWRRQDFDMPPGSTEDGGKVWEHWCTLRDVRETSQIATSVLTSYVSLVAALGDKFPAMVIRGRRDYCHPEQLCAMVQAGFVSKKSALLDITPKPIPANIEAILKTAEPAKELEGIEMLEWSEKQFSYYMYSRKIGSWSTLKQVAVDLDEFGL